MEISCQSRHPDSTDSYEVKVLIVFHFFYVLRFVILNGVKRNKKSFNRFFTTLCFVQNDRRLLFNIQILKISFTISSVAFGFAKILNFEPFFSQMIRFRKFLIRVPEFLFHLSVFHHFSSVFVTKV